MDIEDIFEQEPVTGKRALSPIDDNLLEDNKRLRVEEEPINQEEFPIRLEVTQRQLQADIINDTSKEKKGLTTDELLGNNTIAPERPSAASGQSVLFKALDVPFASPIDPMPFIPPSTSVPDILEENKAEQTSHPHPSNISVEENDMDSISEQEEETELEEKPSDNDRKSKGFYVLSYALIAALLLPIAIVWIMNSTQFIVAIPIPPFDLRDKFDYIYHSTVDSISHTRDRILLVDFASYIPAVPTATAPCFFPSVDRQS